MSVIKVLQKTNYTERVLRGDRLTLSLRFNCTVDKDSYLFSASLPSHLPDLSRKFENIKSEFLSKCQIDTKMLERLINEIDNFKKSDRNTKDFPKLDKYFIPGSSLKGVIRSRIEYKLMYKNNTNAYSCYIVDGYFRQPSSKHLKFWNINDQPREYCEIPKICIVCDMFGNRNLASLTEFSDAVTYDNNPVERLPELGISAIKPNTTFVMDILCKNYDYLRLGLLFLGLELYSKSPILIGMYKYKYNGIVGKELFDNKYWFGKVRFELVNARDINNKEHNIEELLKVSNEHLKNSDIGKNIDLERGVIK